jgi:hypothetical protein
MNGDGSANHVIREKPLTQGDCVRSIWPGAPLGEAGHVEGNTISQLQDFLPYQNKEQAERLWNGLRKAGMLTRSIEQERYLLRCNWRQWPEPSPLSIAAVRKVPGYWLAGSLHRSGASAVRREPEIRVPIPPPMHPGPRGSIWFGAGEFDYFGPFLGVCSQVY